MLRADAGKEHRLVVSLKAREPGNTNSIPGQVVSDELMIYSLSFSIYKMESIVHTTIGSLTVAILWNAMCQALNYEL